MRREAGEIKAGRPEPGPDGVRTAGGSARDIMVKSLFSYDSLLSF
jgi:hypothetical protein